MIELQDKGNDLYVIKINMQEVHTLDVPDLKEKLQQAIVSKGIKKMVIDLSDVKMITSSGIGIFLNINQSLKSQLRLASPNQEVQRVLELTKVTSMIKVFDTVDAAINSF
ncbi:MAG TPA: STAS domain-containing protein [Spirochaetota bacterium]|nr:STAS domain-containing protein [Spirochaetota bacterium]